MDPEITGGVIHEWLSLIIGSILIFSYYLALELDKNPHKEIHRKFISPIQ